MSDGPQDRLLLREVRCFRTAGHFDVAADVRVMAGTIVEIGQGLALHGCEVVEGRGLLLAPGFVDLRACAREPGNEHEEDLCSLSDAAAAGGFTAVVVGPDTQPDNDDHAVTELILRRAREYGRCDVLPQGALSHQLKGEALAPMGEMAAAGAVCFGDGDRPVTSSRLLRRALEYASGFGRPIFTHPVDADLAGAGVMHEGAWSTRLGLRGQPSEVEAIAVARDLAIAGLAAGRLHFARLTTGRGVELVREARRAGVAVTAAVTPWHLTLTDAALRDYDTNLKFVAPLRTETDRQALLQGLRDGTLDAVCSDHMPENIADKALEFDYAAPGAIGLQTVLPQLLSCVRAGELPLEVVLAALTSGPRRVLGLPPIDLVEGARADVVLLDPAAFWRLDAETNRSHSENSVLFGCELQGRVLRTWFGGRTVFRAT